MYGEISMVHKGTKRNAYRILARETERMGPVKDPELKRMIAYKYVLKIRVGRAWTGLNLFRIGTWHRVL